MPLAILVNCSKLQAVPAHMLFSWEVSAGIVISCRKTSLEKCFILSSNKSHKGRKEQIHINNKLEFWHCDSCLMEERALRIVLSFRTIIQIRNMSVSRNKLHIKAV